MKDSMKPCQQHTAVDAEYKEVVVIGNGPSGMVTSFMLAGNVPYLKPVPDDLPIDEMLRARLSNLPPGVSLYEVDLMELAEGLEGRSQNPIPLLMDNLLRPCADLGIMADPLIEWKHEADKQIEHIVLGRGPPGGSWHTFPASVRTLSPAAWLSLPPHAATAANRLPATAVAKYCRRYVQALNLQRYFRSNVVVTSVTVLPPAGEHCIAPQCPLNAQYQVTGYEVSTGVPFRYICNRVVVCGGNGSRPNILPAAPPPTAAYTLPDFVRGLDCVRSRDVVPVAVVVGGGVSGADAVCAALARGAEVAHVHRGAADTLARLDPHSYPDYSQVYKLMTGGRDHPNYKSYPNHIIIDVTTRLPAQHFEDTQTKTVTLLDLNTNTTTEIQAQVIGVYIGSKPDLSFLQVNFNINICDCTKRVKRKIEDKPYWSYIKSILGQSIQICKARYLNNYNLDEKCKCDSETSDFCDRKCDYQNQKCTCDFQNQKCTCDYQNQKCTCDYQNQKCTCDYQNQKCTCDYQNQKCTCDYQNQKCTCDYQNQKCTCDYQNQKCICDLHECKCDYLNIKTDYENFVNGIGFGVDPKKPIDSRNPITIDKGTHEVLNAPKGVYALGPLTADNFVRFIPGGALAVVSHIHRDRN